MVWKMRNLLFTLCIAVAALCACSGSSVDKVKETGVENARIKEMQNATIGSLVNGYAHFTVTSWMEEPAPDGGSRVTASAIVPTEYWYTPLENDNPWDVPHVNSARLELVYRVCPKSKVTPDSIIVTYIENVVGALDGICQSENGEAVEGGCRVTHKGADLAVRLQKMYAAMAKHMPLPL